MSLKTLRLHKSHALAPNEQRRALKRTACAVGLLVLAPTTAFALELGDAALRSGIGQALLVEIPYGLAPGERLTPACIRLIAAPRADGALPTYSRASSIAVTPTHIEIAGAGRVLEPLLALTVDVHCATAPRFVRSYQLLVDPPARMPAVTSTRLAAIRSEPAIDAAARPAPLDGETTNAEASRAAAGTPPRAPRPNVSARARGQAGGILVQGQAYIVVRGDTLSGIASRVGGRPASIRETAEAIFVANPGAFTGGNRDLLEAGRSITIPSMTAATAPLPEPASQSSVAAYRDVELPTVVPPLSAQLSPASTVETTPLPTEAAPRAVVTTAEPAAAVSAVERSAAPVAAPDTLTLRSSSPATTQRTSAWLTILLAIGAAALLSTPLLLVRRRKQQATLRDFRSPHPRLLADPVGGIDVVEEHAASDASSSSKRAAAALASDPPALAIGPTHSVDIDVGAPVVVEERLAWFDGQTVLSTTADASVDAAIDDAATARMAEIPKAGNGEAQPLETNAAASEQTIDDQQHTLTIVELDMLRQDYETEHTLTQEANKALRDAVADLKATQAARGAGAETVTLEMPQAETIDTQATQKLRSSR